MAFEGILFKVLQCIWYAFISTGTRFRPRSHARGEVLTNLIQAQHWLSQADPRPEDLLPSAQERRAETARSGEVARVFVSPAKDAALALARKATQRLEITSRRGLAL